MQKKYLSTDIWNYLYQNIIFSIPDLLIMKMKL